MYVREKRNEEISSGNAGKGSNRVKGRKQPKGIELEIWDQSVGNTELEQGSWDTDQRGRKPAKTLQEYKYENKRLKMEVELLRDFLSLTGKE